MDSNVVSCPNQFFSEWNQKQCLYCNWHILPNASHFSLSPQIKKYPSRSLTSWHPVNHTPVCSCLPSKSSLFAAPIQSRSPKLWIEPKWKITWATASGWQEDWLGQWGISIPIYQDSQCIMRRWLSDCKVSVAAVNMAVIIRSAT